VRDVSEGVPTPAGYSRSTGTVHALFDVVVVEDVYVELGDAAAVLPSGRSLRPELRPGLSPNRRGHLSHPVRPPALVVVRGTGCTPVCDAQGAWAVGTGRDGGVGTWASASGGAGGGPGGFPWLLAWKRVTPHRAAGSADPAPSVPAPATRSGPSGCPAPGGSDATALSPPTKPAGSVTARGQQSAGTRPRRSLSRAPPHPPPATRAAAQPRGAREGWGRRCGRSGGWLPPPVVPFR